MALFHPFTDRFVKPDGKLGSPPVAEGPEGTYVSAGTCLQDGRCPPVYKIGHVLGLSHIAGIKEKEGMLVDLAPTILELLDLPEPEVMTGQSLLRTFKNKQLGQEDEE